MARIHTGTILSVLAIAFSVAAQEKKPGDPPGELFFTGKGQQPFALERVYPGITAALQLTDDQKAALHDALDRTVRSPAVRAAAAGIKGNPDATQAQKDEARRSADAARLELMEAVAKTLTADQKALVSKIQAAYEESQKAAADGLKEEFGAAKGDADKAARLRQRLQEDLRAEMTTRLEKILTREQKSAVDMAGMLQREREEDAARNPKKKG